MGHRNVRNCLLAQPPIRLPARTFHCLLLMATAAHDDTGLYWAGVEWLAMNLGLAPGPGGRRAVMEHIERLEQAGYVTRTPKRIGRRRVYELHLPGAEPSKRYGE
jgi:DNA-binding transcriptional ArsR family regulator